MNIPNRLTIIRMFLTPVFMAVVMLDLPHNYLWGLLAFVIAAFTDFLDGRLARKNNQVTVFGKLADPVADKMLTTAALLVFVAKGLCNIWIVMIVLTREFAVMSVRLVASAQGVVIPANTWGKLKTISQMVFTIAILAFKEIEYLGYFPKSLDIIQISNILLWITAILTVVSGIIYIVQSKKQIDFSK